MGCEASSCSLLCVKIQRMNTASVNSNVENVELQIEKWLSSQPSIQFAILFGSFAKKTNTADSDIDIAVELDEPLSSEIKLSFLQAFSEITNRKIDLVDLKTIGEPLLSQIIQYGKVLKGTKEDWIRLTIKNVNLMQDFSPYLKRTLEERRVRLLYG